MNKCLLNCFFQGVGVPLYMHGLVCLDGAGRARGLSRLIILLFLWWNLVIARCGGLLVKIGGFSRLKNLVGSVLLSLSSTLTCSLNLVALKFWIYTQYIFPCPCHNFIFCQMSH